MATTRLSDRTHRIMLALAGLSTVMAYVGADFQTWDNWNKLLEPPSIGNLLKYIALGIGGFVTGSMQQGRQTVEPEPTPETPTDQRDVLNLKAQLDRIREDRIQSGHVDG